MPITTVPEARRRRDPYAWYSVAEATWAVLLVALPFLVLLVSLLLGPAAVEVFVAGLGGLVVGPSAFFLFVRMVAAIATLLDRVQGGAR